jgi:hypothetical protein
VGTGLTAAALQIADVQPRLHDPPAAELALQSAKEDPRDPTVAAITHFVRGRLAADSGDTARSVTEMEAFGTAYAIPDVGTNYPMLDCAGRGSGRAPGQGRRRVEQLTPTVLRHSVESRRECRQTQRKACRMIGQTAKDGAPRFARGGSSVVGGRKRGIIAVELSLQRGSDEPVHARV